MRKHPVLTALALLILLSAQAQTHTAKTVSINSNCNGYYEYLPINYASSQTNFPLMIYCGGAGTFGSGTASQLNKLLAEGPPYYINNNQFPKTLTVNGETTSYIVISPQFIAWPGPNDVEAVLNYVLSHNYKVDQSRIYLTGFSAGGDVTWKYPNTGLTRAKRLAALVPVAGYNYPYVDSGAKYIAGANLPVWAIHSNDDQTAPATWSQNFVNKVNSFNPPIRAKITRFSAGIAHDPTKLYVYNPTFRDAGFNVYEWMLQFRRNYPPIAKAGADVALTLPSNSTNFNAGGSSDPENTPLSFSWTKISGPVSYSIVNPSSATPSVSGLVAGVYNFELTVTDGDGYSSKDTVKVTVTNPFPNQLPVADGGSDRSITLPQNSVSLVGSASSDADGDIETYQWSKISGPTQLILSNASSVNATASNLKKGVYVFRLVVTDNEGGVDDTTVQLTVINPFPNVAPVSKAGSDQTITLPVSGVTIDGSSSADSDGDIVSYLWREVSGPSAATIANASVASTTVSNLQPGLYRFELKVTDDNGAVGKDSVDITVLPPPSLNSKYVKVNLYGGTNPYNLDGWNNWNVTGTNNITSSNFKYSDGTVSTVNGLLSYSQGIADNGASYGGTICPPQVLRYTSYTTAASRTLTIKGLNNTLKYDVEFYASRATTGNSTTFIISGVSKTVVTDNNKSSGVVFIDLVPNNGQIVVTINKSGTYSYINGFTLIEKSLSQPVNLAPVANAGNDTTIDIPASLVQLNGNASADSDGTINSYTWTKISGPSSFNIVNPGSAVTDVDNLVEGVYAFELAVADNYGAIGKDTVYVTVNNPGPKPPVSNAGLDVVLTWPLNSVQLNGNGSFDPNGTIVSYQWTEVSGPAGFAIDNASVVNPVISGLGVGTYLMELVVVDNDGQPAKDTVAVIVNQPPVSNAGLDVQMTLPQNSVQLSGSGSSDPDGSIASYQWSRVSGPSQFNITSASSVSPVVSNLVKGIYKFELLVTDNRGAVSKDTVMITVFGLPNVGPVARAGNDQSITGSSTTLNGSSSSDADGVIASYQWTQVEGASGVVIASAGAAITGVSGLAVGTYKFELVVTDDSSAVAKDTMVVTVSAVPNVVPVARAGNDQNITLPASSATVSGALSSDADGSIVTYQWNQVTGAAAVVETPGGVSTVISGLAQGSYSFELVVTDNSGGVGKDTVVINVLPAAVTKLIKVNVYGGTNPYNQDGWNNWNVPNTTTVVASSNFTYDNGSASGVSATISNSQGIADNGASYGGTMCPAPVLRYNSLSTSTRSVVLRGLDNTLKYDIEFYSSRANTGNSTTFTIGGVNQTVVTDNNLSNKVVYTNLSPANGQISITLARVGTYNYLNGFILTEKAPQTGTVRTDMVVESVGPGEERVVPKQGTMMVYPNPFRSTVQVALNSPYKGQLILTLSDANGKIIKQTHYNKGSEVFSTSVSGGELTQGVYYIRVQADKTYTQKLIRLK